MEKSAFKNNYLSFISKYYPYFLVSIAAIVLVSLLATSSPSYTMNPWDDVSCYYGVAKAMNNGRVLYKEIYEQKGPYMYFMYQVFLLFNQTGFTGLFIGEMIIAVLCAIISYKTITLVDNNTTRGIIFTILVEALYYNSYVYYLGGSAEEMVLPLLYLSAYIMTRLLVKDDLTKKSAIALGIACGYIFMVKFSIALIIVFEIAGICIYYACNKKYKELLHFGLTSIGGFVLIIVPEILYLLFTQSFKDFFVVYIHNNISVYKMSNSTKHLVETFFRYSWFSYLSLFSVLLVFINRDINYKKKIAFAIYLFSLLFISFKEGMLWYYCQPLVILAPLCAVFLPRVSTLIYDAKYYVSQALLIASSIIVIFTFIFIDESNMVHMSRTKDFYPYYQMAEVIERDNLDKDKRTMLAYQTMDNDLYLIANIAPSEKYFCYLNIFSTLPEGNKEQREYIINNKVTYVFTQHDFSGIEEFKNYELVYSFETREYARYLYRLKGVLE